MCLAMLNNTRLDTITTRQRNSRVRDVVFAFGIAVLTMVSLASVSTACHAATTTARVAQR
jgi:hypothetical protein